MLQLLATGGTGGAQESYTGLLLRLDRSAYEVRALSLSSGSAVHRLRKLGLEVEVIDEADDEAAVRELTAFLVREEIDLLHAHMYRAEVVGARAALAAGTAVVMATVHSSRVRSAEDIATLAALTPVMDRLIVPSASIVSQGPLRGTRRRVVQRHPQRGRPGPIRPAGRRLRPAPRVRHSRLGAAPRRGGPSRAGEGAPIPP